MADIESNTGDSQSASENLSELSASEIFRRLYEECSGFASSGTLIIAEFVAYMHTHSNNTDQDISGESANETEREGLAIKIQNFADSGKRMSDLLRALGNKLE